MAVSLRLCSPSSPCLRAMLQHSRATYYENSRNVSGKLRLRFAWNILQNPCNTISRGLFGYSYKQPDLSRSLGIPEGSGTDGPPSIEMAGKKYNIKSIFKPINKQEKAQKKSPSPPPPTPQETGKKNSKSASPYSSDTP